MNWKMIAIGLASLIGVGAIVGVTVMVVKHDQPAAPPVPLATPQASAPAVQQDDSAARRRREIRAQCRELAQEKVKARTGEVMKDTAIGALIGAGTGSAGGAIADGGSGAGKGAAIGGVVGAVGGAVYGLNKNSKEAIFKQAYDDCLSSRL